MHCMQCMHCMPACGSISMCVPPVGSMLKHYFYSIKWLPENIESDKRHIVCKRHLCLRNVFLIYENLIKYILLESSIKNFYYSISHIVFYTSCIKNDIKSIRSQPNFDFQMCLSESHDHVKRREHKTSRYSFPRFFEKQE